MMGYTPYMVEALMNEPSMDPMKWRQTYSSIILDPLSLIAPNGRQVLPSANDRRNFRENVARRQPIAARKYNMMKTQDVAGEMEGIE